MRVPSIRARTSVSSSSSDSSEQSEGRLKVAEHRLDPRHHGERLLEPDQIAWTRGPERRTRHEPLEVLDVLDGLAELPAIDRAERQLFDGIETIANAVEREQRPQQPRAQRAAADRGHGAIQLFEQRALASSLRSFENLEVLQGRSVDQQRVGALPKADGADVGEIDLLGRPQVVDEGAGGRHGGGAPLQAETLQTAGAKLVEQRAAGRFGFERPAVERRDRAAGSREDRPLAGSRARIGSGRNENLAGLQHRELVGQCLRARRRPCTRRS